MFELIAKLFLLAVMAHAVIATNQKDNEIHMHPKINSKIRPKVLPGEDTSNYWNEKAQNTLKQKLVENTKNYAKNVIMFLGDGMSLPTLAATRVYVGAQDGNPGEETVLSFEEFPYTGLSKTYCVDTQVADSACSATAYLTGVKGNYGTIGYTAAVPRGSCNPSLDEYTKTSSIARWAQLKNKWTGLVTTTRVTHASPSGVYASTSERGWEADSDVANDGVDPTSCRDIAHQLVYGDTGKNLHVIMGGGRSKMLPKTEVDEEGTTGERLDGVNLIQEWINSKSGENAAYVWNTAELKNISSETDYLMGLFEGSHTRYNLERTEDDPSLEEMTIAAIQVLEKNRNGYFLFVEGGKIDLAHHETWAHKALDEASEFSKAIRMARQMTNIEDTLIVVTSDHAHTMSLSGYAPRGNNIFGLAGEADDGLQYSTLSYANGNGYKPVIGGQRWDLTQDDMSTNEYLFPALDPLDSETHGGDDVAIFASGPLAHLFSGVIEQNVIPHIIAYAMCVGDGITFCDE